MVYEYIITFREEVELFWTKEKTGATALFLANRYLTLACYIYPLVVELLPQTDYNSKVCLVLPSLHWEYLR